MQKSGPAKSAGSSGSALGSLDAIVDAKIDAKLARLHVAAFAWVRCGPSTISTKCAYSLQKREGVRVTKIGKYVYVHRDDLESLAARNVVQPDAANDVDPLEGLDPTVAEAIRTAAGAR